jgi:tetratricopeptide (TPR) repeat protein
MKRLGFLLFIFFGCSFFLMAQKIKVISVFQLIENAKYNEAKTTIEEAITEDKTMNWYKTWYARGLLCQTAYQTGIKEKDKKKYELYPDQLYVAYDSYEKALSLGPGGRLEGQVAPMYVLLANDFQKLGENYYDSKNYEDALKAFEHALKITHSPILSVQPDTNLVYNTALAAFECNEWEKAIEYLSILHAYHYSVNVTHLLSDSYLAKGDTISAERVLSEGIHGNKDNEDLVLLLVDLLYKTDHNEKILSILDSASSMSPSNYIYPYTKGLFYQKKEQYDKAIDAYREAIKLAPDEVKIYTNLSTCYYNSGVEIEENARKITSNSIFLEEKAKSEAAFESAVSWLEKAHKEIPDNQEVTTKLNQLYKVLGMTDKINSLEENTD